MTPSIVVGSLLFNGWQTYIDLSAICVDRNKGKQAIKTGVETRITHKKMNRTTFQRLGRLILLGTIQNIRDKVMSFPILECASIDARLLTNFKRIHLAVGNTLLLACISKSTVQLTIFRSTLSQSHLEPLLASERH